MVVEWKDRVARVASLQWTGTRPAPAALDVRATNEDLSSTMSKMGTYGNFTTFGQKRSVYFNHLRSLDATAMQLFLLRYDDAAVPFQGMGWSTHDYRMQLPQVSSLSACMYA